MSSFRERNDRNKSGASSVRSPRPGSPRPPHQAHRKYGGGDPDQWVWGWHAVEAALRNPDRPAPKKILATEDRAKQISQLRGEDGRPLGIDLSVEIATPAEIATAVLNSVALAVILPPNALKLAKSGLPLKRPPIASPNSPRLPSDILG